MASAAVATLAQRQPLRRRACALPAVLVAAAVAPFAPSLVNFSLPGHLTGTRASVPSPRAAGRLRAGARAALGLAEATDAKAKLFDLLEDDFLAEEALKPEGRPLRGRMDEAIVQLEKLNPTHEPVYSELLDGTWKVKYTGAYAPGMLASPTRELALFLYSGGFSPGNALASFAAGFWGQALDLRLGERRVQIRDGRDVEASAEVEAAGQKEKIQYTAELMPMSSVRMSEEVVSFHLPGPLGKQDAMLELRRSMLVTYLDEDVMVVRDESGVPEVLVKELAEVVPEPPTPAVEAEANATAGVNTTGAAAVVNTTSASR
uniref:Plastid lipid-associated protein/fibrillin conserved domain-containing protein n=1 Tax=Alexandrium monilatum TaxID=311494 RepID=A0A7S4W511_9DINO